MSLAVDSVMPSGVGFSSTLPTGSSAFVNSAGTLLVVVTLLGNNAAAGFTGVTYGGVAMINPIGSVVTWDSGNSAAACWYLLNPATGSNTLAVTGSGVSGGSTGLTYGAISFTGHDTTTPIRQATSTTGGFTTTSTISLLGVVAGNITVDGTGAGSPLTTDNHTASWVNNLNTFSAGGNGRSSYFAGGSGTISHTHTISSSDLFGAVMLEIAAASGVAQDGLEWRSPKSVWIRGYDPVIICP